MLVQEIRTTRIMACCSAGRTTGPPHPDTIARRFKKLTAAVGLPEIDLHDVRHSYATAGQVSEVAAAASFGGSGERALRAVQRAALEQARSHGSPGTLRDLRCHHPLASSGTMMQPVRLQRIPA